MKILVVDDEIPVATVLADALSRDGHDVIVAHDAPEALSLLSQYRPGAVFLAVTLGERAGLISSASFARPTGACPWCS
jgi:DNA-binding response OmpR family regulator